MLSADGCRVAVQYLRLVREVLDEGVERGDRTGTGSLALFGRSMRFSLQHSFPLLTTKKTFFRGELAGRCSPRQSEHHVLVLHTAS